MEYFNHDTGAAGDVALMGLRLQFGGAAVDAYWTLLEQIYRDETDLVFFANPTLTKVVSHRLCIDENTLIEYVNGMISVGLFEVSEYDENTIFSARARQNIADYHAKIETARENGRKGGRRKTAVQSVAEPTKKPRANRTLTKSVSNGLATAKRQPSKPLANKIKENKSVGFHKENQTLLSGHSAPALEGSAEGESATPYCAKCGGVARFNVSLMTFECDECGTLSRERSEVVYR